MRTKNKPFLLLTVLFCLVVPTVAQAGTTTYLYDDLYRLIRVERSDGAVITYQYDESGNRSRKIISPPVSVKGDINGDNILDLIDVILGLQVISGSNPAGITTSGDVNEDQKISIEDVQYVLRAIDGE